MPAEPTAPSQPRARSSGNGGPEPIPPGTQFEALTPDGAFAGEGFQGRDGCGADDGECDECGSCDGPACRACCDDWPVFDGCCGPWLRGLSVFLGGDAFKGPLDRGTNGDFGLNEGLNLARPLGDPWGCGYQIGANFVQSDFSGAKELVIGNNVFSAPTESSISPLRPSSAGRNVADGSGASPTTSCTTSSSTTRTSNKSAAKPATSSTTRGSWDISAPIACRRTRTG